jgi:hypothetical protein
MNQADCLYDLFLSRPIQTVLKLEGLEATEKSTQASALAPGRRFYRNVTTTYVSSGRKLR